MKKPFSKKLLIADYVVSIVLVLGYIICVAINGIYAKNLINDMLSLGLDVGSVTNVQLLNLDGFGILLGVWIAQLGASSGCYYLMLRGEHRLEISTRFVSNLPDDIKENVDMTSVLTTALSTSDN